MSIQKSEIMLDVNEKSVNAYLASGGGPGVLLLHAWWGLKPFFKQVCDQLAEQGFTVLAPDMFDGQVARTIDEAKMLAQGSDSQAIGDIVMAAKDHLHNITKNKIGVMGFSFGAAWSLVAANHDPEKISAVVLFYGAYPTEFKKIKSKVLGHFCEVDEWEPIEGVREMEANMKSAGVDVTLHFYPGVGHWFMESDRPEHDSASAQLAWERTFEFLKANLS
ncbi:MAG: dienelactone hydrolase family protein [Chloroflexi bacterium]|nr:dienelactone hydrolase family protein [Chloroflexota bacterium]